MVLNGRCIHICALYLMLICCSLDCGSGFMGQSVQSHLCSYSHRFSQALSSAETDAVERVSSKNRQELWKEISKLEMNAVEILSTIDEEKDVEKKAEAYRLLAKSVNLRKDDPFLVLAGEYSDASLHDDESKCAKILNEMEKIGLPPQMQKLAGATSKVSAAIVSAHGSSIEQVGDAEMLNDEDVDLSSTFSDTVTEKIRVKVCISDP